MLDLERKLTMSTILALDLATKTGWAVLNPGEWRTPESGVQKFELSRGESPGMRFLRFRRWLEEVVRLYSPAVIVYEQSHHRGGAATEIAVGFSTRVQEVAAMLGAEHVAVHSATLKKHATGSGRAGKEEMIVAATGRWGYEPQDDNEGDALCLLSYAIDRYGARKGAA